MNPTSIPIAQTITQDGVQYVLVGNCRFKVTEHFPEHGKPYDTLLTDIIQRAARSIPAIPADENATKNLTNTGYDSTLMP